MATGVGLSFDTSFLQNLEKADKKMSDLLDKSNTLSRSAVSAFQQISKQGVEPYLRKLQEQKEALEAIKNIDITSNSSSQFKKLQRDVTKTVEDINKLISALEKTPQMKTFNTQQYNNYELQLFLESQDKKKQAEQDMAAIQKRNREQYIQEVTKMFADEDAKIQEKKNIQKDYYNYVSQRLIEHARQSKSVGLQILESERNYHNQRQKMYEQLFSLQNKLAIESAQKSLALQMSSIREAREMLTRVGARTDGKEWNVSAEDTIKKYQKEMAERKKYIKEQSNMYEHMFDEINRKEQQSAAERERIVKELEKRKEKERLEAAKREKQAIEDVRKYESEVFEESLKKYKKIKEDQAKVDKHYHDKKQRELEDLFKRESASDAERYELWLRRKHREQIEHKQTEDAKLKATQDAIARQNAYYAQLETYKQQSTQAKTNSEKAKADYENQLRMYSQMFDEVAKREKKSQEEVRRYEQSLFDESLNKYRKSKEEQASVDRHYHDKRQREYEEMFRQIDELARRESQARAKMYQSRQQTGDTSGQAFASFDRLYSSVGSRSIKNMEQSIQRMQQAQQKLNLNTEEGRKRYDELAQRIAIVHANINRATESSRRFANENKGLLNTTEQLKNAFTGLFAVSAISGYYNQLVQVRGEFEMHHRSMQILIGDTDEANKLWNKTIALAIKSPFRVKDLVSYTKQLAAYRVESDKLYETNKMLADVSAGLGVDMQRLILAYGQVKAANYLRGTELRQFSEAGVNMLGELSNLYSEIEKRTVTVGDVFDRISKRLVTFEDVHEVFRRITSEGGTFYKMQEKQSETLKGQIMNLRDSFDLMLNDIGSANDGVMKGTISLARSLVQNWEAVADALKLVISALALYKIQAIASSAATKLLAIDAGVLTTTIPKTLSLMQLWRVAWYKLTLSVKSFGAAMKALFAGGNIWLIAIAAIAAAMYELITWNDELNDKLKDVYKERDKELSQVKELVREYERLKKAQKGTAFEGKRDVLSKLIKQGKGLGINIPIEIENLDEDEIDTKIQEIQAIIKDSINFGAEFGRQIAEGLTAAEGWFNIFGENLETDLNELSKANAKILGGSENTIDEYFNYLGANYEKLSDEARKYYDEIKLGRKDNEEDEEYLLRRIEYAQKINSLYKAYKYTSNGVAMSIGHEVEYSEDILDLEEKRLKIVNNTNEVYHELDKVIDGIKNAYNVEDFGDYTDSQKAAFRFRIDEEFEKMQLDESTKRMAAHYIANKLKIPYEFVPTEEKPLEAWQQRVLDAVEELGDLSGIVFGEANVRGKTKEQVQNYVKGLKEAAEKVIKKFDIPNQQLVTQEEYDYALKQLPILEKMENIVALGSDNKKDKEANKELEKRISLIKEMHKQYQELRKEYDENAAKQKVMNDYARAFKEIFGDDGIQMRGNIIDEKSLEQLREGGELSEDLLSKIEDLRSKGSFIRDYTEDAVLDIKANERFVSQAYNIGDGKWTIGYGETKNVKQGDTITQEEADMQLRKRLTEDFAKSLNKVLDANQDLILTQTQYNTLLDLTYQGGAGAVKNLLKYANDETLALEHINRIYNKIKNTIGEESAERFGEAFVNKFKESENIYERISMLLQTMNLTVNGGKISERLYQGLQKRSDNRSLAFLYEKDFIEVIDKISTSFDKIDITSKNGVVRFFESLRPLAEAKGEEVKEALEKEIGKFKSENELELRIWNRENLENEIEGIFSSYELSVELGNIGIEGDLAKQLFNVEDMDLNALKQKLSDYIKTLRTTSAGVLLSDASEEEKKLAENNLKLAQQTEDKIKKKEQQALKERAKEYLTYLVKAMNDRVKIKVEELQKIKELEENTDFTEPQKDVIREGIRREANEKLDIEEWEKFKSSDIYEYMFEDLENVGTRTISTLLSNLENLKESLTHLPADKYKEIVKEIEKLEEIKLERNPITALVDAANNLDNVKNKYKDILTDLSYKGVESSYLDSQINIGNLEQELDDIDTIIKLQEKGVTITEEEANARSINTQYLNKDLLTLYEIRGETEQQIGKEQEKSNAAKNVKNAYETQANSIQKVSNNIQAWGEAFNGVLDGIDSILDAFGVAEESSARIWIESTKQIANMIVQVVLLQAALVQMGIAANSALGVIGIIATALTAIGTMLSTIFQQHDKALDKEIEGWQKRVERLQKAYENLEEAIDNAYTSLDVKQDVRKANQNINEQIRSYQFMIQAEKDKKKTDYDKIQEYYDTIADLRKQQKELERETVESFGGSYDFRGVTREFVDAWVDAFKETGNGLHGLQENFSEFFSNVIAEQAVMQGASTIMKPLLDSINSSLAEDYTIDESEYEAIGDLQQQTLGRLDEFLEGWYGRFGDYLEVGELSGLQRGIEGVSESTAQVIEALLNSIRFYVTDSNTQLKTLVSAQVGSSVDNTPNPMLEQLKIIAVQTTAIHDLFDSVVGTGHPRGRSGIRVFVD